MVGDVALGVLARADLLGRRLAHDDRPQLLQRVGDQVLHPGGQYGKEPTEVLGVPGAGQVSLTEPDELVAAEAGVELRGSTDRHERPAAAQGLGAGRVVDDDGDRQPLDGLTEQALGDPG